VEHLPNAQLILYSDSSHGAQYQHAEMFLEHLKLFLNDRSSPVDHLTQDTSQPRSVGCDGSVFMKEMAKHVPDAGSYAPLTVLVDERDDVVLLSYDRMASLLAPYGNAEASAVARDLDVKVENLLRESAA